ncbi:hypothetical protein GGS24DRAFT_206970 [Hypoxylon argillaceum]|nr:hypothetical protein GGS24DRAFT_206970 [Hypoxylon argillaceum]
MMVFGMVWAWVWGVSFPPVGVPVLQTPSKSTIGATLCRGPCPIHSRPERHHSSPLASPAAPAPAPMDPASLDPRLRDAGEDSIVVRDSTQRRHVGVADVDALSEASSDEDEGDEYAPRQPQTLTGIGIGPASAITTPTGTASILFTPQTPARSSNVFPPPLSTPSSASIAIAPAPTPTSAGAATPHDPNDPKRPRACEACRGLKVKCEPDLHNPDGPCKRCAKAGRDCIVTQPTRKRQKKTDSRVAELEKKIDALTASLHASRGSASGGSIPPPPPPPPPPSTSTSISAPHPRPAYPSEAEEATRTRVASEWGPPAFPPAIDNSTTGAPPAMAGQKRKFAESTKAPGPDVHKDSQPSNPGRQQLQPDVVDRRILTVEQAADLFRRYTDCMATHLPAVVFPPGTTADEVRKTSPIMFLAIMSVASSETPNTQRVLVKELMQIFANKIIIQGQKSLELVQSIMISVIWYFPPEHFEELKFYQLVHLAGVMAIDIGLGRKKNSPKSRLIPYTWRDHPFRKHALPDPTTIESRRTWLAAYFLASNVAMALHRPNLIRWQSFMTECMDILESSPEAAPSDRYLCHLVWTHRLAEEVGIQFSMDDPSIFVDITAYKVQYALRGFERDLQKYSKNIPKEDKQPSLLLSFSVMNLYMHEIALQTNDEFTASNAEALRDPIPHKGETLTPAHISALSSCLTAIDSIFETFLSLDVPTIRCLPIFNFVRVAYAVVVLIKIYFSATSPSADLGKVINKDNMKVAEYIDRLLDRFRETAALDKSRPAGKFLMVLIMVRGWFQKQGQPQGDQNIDPALKPSEAPQNAPTAKPPKLQDKGPPPRAPHDQQRRYQPPQNRIQSEYNPANTPLQLLSEVATGNNPPQGGQGSGPPSAPNLNPPGYPNWIPPGEQLPYMYDPTTGLPTSAAGAPGAMGPTIQPLLPWPGGVFGGEIDYMSMGDGFEQAMGLTLTGFGGGSPGDEASYENSMRMTQNDPSLMGLMDEFPGGPGGVFRF